jgi:hypothetical protein
MLLIPRHKSQKLDLDRAPDVQRSLLQAQRGMETAVPYMDLCLRECVRSASSLFAEKTKGKQTLICTPIQFPFFRR